MTPWKTGIKVVRTKPVKKAARVGFAQGLRKEGVRAKIEQPAPVMESFRRIQVRYGVLGWGLEFGEMGHTTIRYISCRSGSHCSP